MGFVCRASQRPQNEAHKSCLDPLTGFEALEKKNGDVSDALIQLMAWGGLEDEDHWQGLRGSAFPRFLWCLPEH
jgi:hypothetical protein